MRLHQVLTGAANTSENGASVGYGAIEDYPFIVYSSGCDVVILDSQFQRAQIITNQCATSNHIGLITCSETDGKIAVAYGKRIRVFTPTSTPNSIENKSLPFEWLLVTEFSTTYGLNCLVWDREGKRLLTGGQLLELWIEVAKGDHSEGHVWTSVWHTETAIPVCHVEFSSDGLYFASLGKDDCLVKIWFEIEKGNPLLLNNEREGVFYDFLYIAHPRSVTGFSWRRTSSFMPRNCVANVLLTSCADNICRIWCETMETKVVAQLQPEDPSHCERHQARTLLGNMTSLHSFNVESDHHFHIAATIDPAKDIPIMSTVSFFTATENDSSLVLHWVNNKEMFMTSAANFMLGSPSVTVEAESTYSEISRVDSPFDFLGEDDNEDNHVLNESDHAPSLSPFPLSPQTSPSKQASRYSSNLVSQFHMLLREWKRSPDSLLAINPADGSLLVWLLESLDVSVGADFRQTQVSFSSCIPNVFPSADAHSLLQNLILYRIPGKLNFHTCNAADSGGHGAHGRPKASTFSSQSSSHFSLVSLETGAHPPVALISTHKDGSMNQWQVDFADSSGFSTLISLSHLTRLSGHRFPLTGMFPHPSLPLLLSVSTFSAQHCEADSELGETFSFSELILWQCDSVFPLSQNGGIMELAKITSSAQNAFDKVAWLPKLFINSLVTFDSSVTLSPKAVSPCACFVASDDTGLRFYQVVLDGRELLDFLSGKQNFRRGLERTYSFGSEEDDGIDTEYPSVSSMHHLLHCIVSDQSGAKPGSVLKLNRLRNSQNLLTNLVFLHAFSEHAVVESGTSGRTHCLGSEESWGEENFFLVALDSVDHVTRVHMWMIEVTTSTEDSDVSSLETPLTSSSPVTSSSPLDAGCAELQENVKCGIRSRKVLTSALHLPKGVYVTIATASTNTLSAVSENRSCAVPYLIATMCSDGVLRFWTCDVESVEGDLGERYTWFEVDKRYEVSLATVGAPVSMDCASSGHVAVVTHDKKVGYRAMIWETESSGNTEWMLEDWFDIEADDVMTSNAAVKWFSCENGSFVLAVAIGSVIHLYSLTQLNSDELHTVARNELQAGSSNELRVGASNGLGSSDGPRVGASNGLGSSNGQQAAVNHRYSKLEKIETRSCTVPTKDGVFVSFVRRGLLIVGIGYEVHVFSQWKDGRSGQDHVTSDVLPRSDVTSGPGLFNEVLRRNPTLPQYHPKYLTGLLDFGKLRRVRAILNHLVRCVAGDEATQAAVWSTGDTSRSRTRSVISTLNRTTSLSSTPVDSPVKGDTSYRSDAVDCIPPIPISDLLNADHDDTGVTHKHQETVDEKTTAEPTEEKDYSELFSTSFKNSFDSSEFVEREISVVSHVKQSPVHFGLAQAGLLAEHLSRKQLPGLSRTEQLELQALADTLATTKTDLEESSSKIDRGLKFARKNDRETGFMGGPSGGGGGYATTGSIGASEGSGGDAVDECGLRFLLAMRHHTCLLRSLPLVARTQLQHKGLSSSKFVWAFHSDSQEELLAMLPGMIRGEPTWVELRQYGVGWWIRSKETLKRVMEKVAKAQFNTKQDPMDCSLLYMAMKKKTVLRGLFRTKGESRMATFFNNNFSEDRWRKAALKNAYSLMSKQRFEHAAAFFLLAGSLWDTVQLCINRLNDIQLALVISRLYENDNVIYKRLLTQCVLGNEQLSCSAKKDPFLRSISYWLVDKYHKALRTLLLEPGPNTNHIEGKYNLLAATGSPDIFNFYVYLRTHPVLRRSQFHKGPSLPKTLTHHRSLSESVMLPSPLTNFERRLYFMTAHNHYNAGCPDLSLQVLLELPTEEESGDDLSRDRTETDCSSVTETNTSDRNKDMIYSGTVDWSPPITSKLKKNDIDVKEEPSHSNGDMDWSQPVSVKLGGSGMQASEDFDWSQPVSTSLGGMGLSTTSALDWSEPVSAKLGGSGVQANGDIDWSVPVSTKLGGSGVQAGEDWSKPVSTKLGGDGVEGQRSGLNRNEPVSSDVGASRESAQLVETNHVTIGSPENSHAVTSHDVMNASKLERTCVDAASQRLKFRACLKVIVEELCTLPHHCQIHNVDLRSTFSSWLKKELDLIHRICENETKSRDDSSLVPLTASSPTVLEGVFEVNLDDPGNETRNFAQKVEISAKHIGWLKENQTLLNNLLNYCTLHGASGGDVATMKVELLILIHELEQQRHLMSPLYLTSAGSSIPPLILATMVSTFSLGASPFTYLSSMTQDILKYLTKLPGPPSPWQPLDMISVLRSLSATLSACVFQSLVYGKEDSDTHDSLHSGDPSSVHNNSVPNYHGNKRQPNSHPSKWPGVRLLRSLLITEAKDNASKLKVLLCEICVSIHLSLLAIAFCENDPNQLYYIISNNLTAGMWGLVFGGGHKVKEETSEDTRRQAGTKGDATYWGAARRRWTYKLLQAPAQESKVEKRTKEHEEFIPPQIALMEYFLRKPKSDLRQTMSFDSEPSLPSESEDSEDDAFEDDDRIVKMLKEKKAKPTDHVDPKSFSWRLMNYAVSTLVCRNVNTFLADVGLDIADLPSVSPLLHSAIKMLQHWKQVLFSQLKKCGPPSPDYVHRFTIIEDEYSRGGPTLRKYKALTDPSNTPFRSNSSLAKPAKRLWHTLVHQEELQKIFLQFIFGQDDQPASAKLDQTDTGEEAKILYKDSEAINAFCTSTTNPMRVVIATMRDVQEVDISGLLTNGKNIFVDEDVSSNVEKSEQDSFAMVTYHNGVNGSAQSPHLGSNLAGQLGNGASVMLKRAVAGVKRMEEHPSLPYYLTGSHDGSLRMWEFGHEREIAQYRESGKYQRVTKVHFSHHGSKFGVMDFGGQLALHQSINTGNTASFLTLKCHNKQGNDFAFLGSTSFLATAGHSSDNNNVCFWDTLLPPPGCQIHSFTCHENGAPCMVYVPGKRLLLTGGRKGDVCIIDVGQRQILHTFTAHDSDVKSIAVDESEEYFVTGSLDGDIKVWKLSVHEELLSFPGEHGKSNYQLIKLGTQGVPRISLTTQGQMFSCGGDGTLKWRQLPLKNFIVNSPF